MVDLKGGWAKVWSAIGTALGNLAGLLTAFGVIIVVFAVLKWLWDKRRGGGGQGNSTLGWAMGFGAILAAPGLLIPLTLGLVDVLINAVINIVNSNSNSN